MKTRRDSEVRVFRILEEVELRMPVSDEGGITKSNWV